MAKHSRIAVLRQSLQEHARQVEHEQLMQRRAYLESVNALMEALEARDSSTRGHAERVRAWAIRIGRQLGLPVSQLVELGQAARLHDIGKVGIRDTVLEKPGPLSAEEWQAMRRHPLVGVAILQPIPFLQYTLPVVRGHHERWDGKGYPDGLSGEAIPFTARIVAVADAYDALVSDRVYRPGFDRDHARAILKAGSGAQWDGQVVDGLLAAQLASGTSPAEIQARQVQDVICGMRVTPEDTQARAEYLGHLYFFCSPACREVFDQNPESYA